MAIRENGARSSYSSGGIWSSGVIGRHLIFFAVFVGEYRGTEVAIKKLMNQRMSTTEIAQFAQEVATMVNLRHPNILLFMGACAGMLGSVKGLANSGLAWIGCAH